MRRRALALTTAGLVAAGGLALAPAPTNAAPRDFKRSDHPELGSGLGRLVEQSGQRATLKKQGAPFRLDQEKLAIRDAQGRVGVDLTPQAGTDRAAFRKQAEALGLVVTATDAARGTLEGFVPLAKVQQLAALQGTGTIAQTLKPVTRVGSTTSQGVAFQRVDALLKKGIDGKGITVGVLSDSYDTALYDFFGNKQKIHAKQDIKSGDLPGKGNSKYPSPVVVIEDGFTPDTDTDEGRAMLQIVHDMAPGAKLCFATAFSGEIGFADNIRKLAAKNGPCKADVIVDDVGYFSEPFFSDGTIGDAVDDVAAQGVQYYSSAGNDGEQQSWDSKVRLIPAKQGVKGTNLDLSDVDPELISGGLQDMDPGSGTDVAQDLVLGTDGLINVQWDDPFDVDGAVFGTPYFTAKGELKTATDVKTFTWNAPQSAVGKTVQFRTDGVPSGSVDLVLTVTDPDGTVLGEIDTGSSPEVFGKVIQKAGAYKIAVSGFDGDTGPFTVDVRPVVSPSKVKNDFNVLLFDEDGNYVTSFSDLNTVTGRPQELGFLEGDPDGSATRVQMVISRAGTGPVTATRLRNIMFSDIYTDEYTNPLAPAIHGHPMAKGATAVAAYDPFKPYLPEFYTSPGGQLPVFFDSAGNRYSSTQTRTKPEVAGTDRGNTTFFVADDLRDDDTFPNFGGTSASAPHVAAISALVLQKRGGPRSVSPNAMRTLMKSSTFTHDLDPMHSEGSAGGVTLSADGPQGSEQDVANGPMTNPDFFKLRYSGPARIKSITLFANTASPTSLAGMVFDRRRLGNAPSYRDNGFPFVVGSTSGGLNPGTVGTSFAGTGAGDSTTGQFSRMTISFANGLRSGQGLSFGIDRDLAVSGFGGANEGNGADELGGNVLIPSGQVKANGLKFVATLTDGKTVTGYMKNKLGSGFSPVDGWGLVNAEKAVLGSSPY